MKKKFFSLILSVAILTICALPSLTLAGLEEDINYQLDPIADVYGQSGTVHEGSLAITIAQIIKAVLTLLGIIFIALIVYAGFVWMTSAGNDDKINRAKKTIVAAIIGAAIVILAYAITNFVIRNLVNATI